MPADEPSPHERLDRLEERIDRLEAAVDALRAAVEAPDDASSDEATPPDEAPPDPSAAPEASGGRGASTLRALREAVPTPTLRGEDWLSYVGIGLLLFGVAFLFKYSIEQGWLTPAVRVGVGAVTGGVLLWAGLTRTAARPRLQQILLGGGVATFYGTIFAAYQLYGLLSYPVAFGGMVFTTTLAIAVAVQQDHASTAVIGTLGGLGTPFLLYAEVDGVAGFALYTGLVLAGACAVYLYRGWRSLLSAAVGGGWLVLLVPCVDALVEGAPPDGAATLQGSIVLAWLLLGGTPVLRRALRAGRGGLALALPPAPASRLRALFGPAPSLGLLVASPLAALLASRLLWTGPDGLWAGVAAGGALLYAGLYGLLRTRLTRRVAAAHGVVAAVLAAYALGVALDGATLLLTWAVEGALLLALGRRAGDPRLRLSGHALFGIVAVGLARRWAAPGAPPTPAALSELLALGSGLAAARTIGARWGRRLYQGLALAGWLAWCAHTLAPLPAGAASVSVAWGGTAAALLAGGAWARHPLAQKAGLAVLALFVGKLFLVDLAALPALGRIGLFLGAGAAFLLISYALPGLGPGADSPPPSD
jgi:uncharacterized membrane protein